MSKRRNRNEDVPVIGSSAEAHDPLDMTVRDLLAALVARGGIANDGEWINIRGETYPWRRIVASAEKGECEVSRVGRRLMMRREELNRWLSSRRIVGKKKPNDATTTSPEETEMERRVRRSLERQGYKR